MIKRCSVGLLVGVMMTMATESSEAQFSVGISRQGGIVTGASLQVGGFVNPGRTGVRLGVSSANNQLRDIQTFSIQNGGGNPAVVNSRQRPRMTPGRFVRAAQRFDEDNNDVLDEVELAAVGTAVLAELELRKAAASQRPVAARKIPAKSVDQTEAPPVDPKVDAFVRRCLKFDRDKDGVLNKKETSRMAKALIRSLS